jgi:hypothetical protein
MSRCGVFAAKFLVVCACALFVTTSAFATGVPVGGYLPLVGVGLSHEYSEELFDWYTYPNTAQPTSNMMLGHGTPNFELALLDTGAGFSALTSQAYDAFNVGGDYGDNDDGYEGANQITFGGATGNLQADVNEPLGLYVAGLQDRSGGASFTMQLSQMTGQTNTSMVTFQSGTDLPNVIGLTFTSRYATMIRSDQPHIFEVDGKTVRAPSVDFFPLGSGVTHGITRRAFLDPAPSESFGEAQTSAPVYLGFGNGEEAWADPTFPTLLQSISAGTFLTVALKNNNITTTNSQFLFDTGADVTVVSAQKANELEYDGNPDFTVAVTGSGGTFFDVPGFFVDQLIVDAENHTNHATMDLVLTNVPVIILDVTNPNGGGIVPGIIGTNVLAGRNAVIDPRPVGSGISPGLFISDPVTTEKNWTTTATSGTFGTGSNWSGGAAPDLTNRGIANVRWVSGGNQTAIVAANATVWEVNVSGTATRTMTLQVNNGVTLQTFSGINIELGGVIELQNATLDTQYVEMLAGALTGTGTIETGSGPIPGQVENRRGTVAPGIASTNSGIGEMEIVGRFANGPEGTIAMQLGGNALGQYDQIVVDGVMTLEGTLSVSLVNSFLPSVGDSFTLITSTDDLGGAFDTLQLPPAFNWGVEYESDGFGLSAVVLTVLVSGDFNKDGIVDMADYVWWSKSGGSPQEYQLWRSNFGMTQPGSGGGSSSGVPEPTAAALLFVVACGLALSRTRPTPPARSAVSKWPGSSSCR